VSRTTTSSSSVFGASSTGRRGAGAVRLLAAAAEHPHAALSHEGAQRPRTAGGGIPGGASGGAAVHYLACHASGPRGRRAADASLRGMLSIQVHAVRQRRCDDVTSAHLHRATSLGGVESLIEHRASIEGPHTTRRRICCGLGGAGASGGPDRRSGAGVGANLTMVNCQWAIVNC